MTLLDVVIKCIQEPRLVAEFNRLRGTKLDFTIHKPKSGLEMMIDQATGYDEVAQLKNKNKSEDIQKFIAFVAECIYLPWLSQLLDSLPDVEMESETFECKRCGECCLSTPCIFAQMRRNISENNPQPCPDLIKTDEGYSCKLIESDELIRHILLDGCCDKVKEKINAKSK
jgi:hypothetical protein